MHARELLYFRDLDVFCLLIRTTRSYSDPVVVARGLPMTGQWHKRAALPPVASYRYYWKFPPGTVLPIDQPPPIDSIYALKAAATLLSLHTPSLLSDEPDQLEQVCSEGCPGNDCSWKHPL